MKESTETAIFEKLDNIQQSVTNLEAHAHDPLTCIGLQKHEERHKNIWPIVAAFSSLCAVIIAVITLIK